MQLTKKDVFGVEVIAVEGALLSTTAPQLESELLACAQVGTKQCVVDLKKTEFVSSAALRVLISAAQQMRERGGRVLLCSLNDEVQKAFEVSNSAVFFNINPNQAAAVAAAFSTPINFTAPPAAAAPESAAVTAVSTSPMDDVTQVEAISFRGVAPEVVSAANNADAAATRPPIPPSPPVVAALLAPPPEPAAVIPEPITPPPVALPAIIPAAPPPPPPISPPAATPPAPPPPVLAPPPVPPSVAAVPPPIMEVYAERRSRNFLPLIVVAVLGLGAVALAAYFFLHRRGASDGSGQPTPIPFASASPIAPATPSPTASPRFATTAPPAPPASSRSPEPEANPNNDVIVTRPNLDPTNAENKQTRAAVLERIDAMPIRPADKEQLRNALDRARNLGKIITINFGSGRAELIPADVANLKQALAQPDVKRIIDDPTAIFAVLGFADAKGDPQANLRVSEQRAKSIIDALKEACGVENKIYSVGMGSSELIGKNASRNRAVEVWAVLP